MRSFSEGPKPIEAVGNVLDLITGGQFSSVCLEVKGAITAGYLTLKGSLQGETQVQLHIENVTTGAHLTSDQIKVAGLYRVSSSAIIHVFVIASSDFAQDSNDPVSIYVTVSESLAPTVA